MSSAAIDMRSWQSELAAAASHHRLSLALDALTAHPDIESWPHLLSQALTSADFPRREHRRLVSVLQLLTSRGIRVFDGDAARQAFEALPPRVVIFRGTCEAEQTSRDYGVCWALDRATAGGFALRHEIARFAVRGRPDIAAQLVPDGFASESVVLSATIDRDDIAGLLLERGEREVLVLPEQLHDVGPAPSDDPIPIDDPEEMQICP